MKNLTKLGLAAVLALGTSSFAMAQDAGVSVDAGAGAATDLQVKPGKVGAGASGNANADLGIDAMTTGSIGNHGNLVSSIQTTQSFDVSAYSDGTEIGCVKTSSLQGNAQGEAQAIGNAAAGNSALADLRADIEANANLMTALEAQCDVAEFDLNDVVFVETGADGNLVFYYHDSAA